MRICKLRKNIRRRELLGRGANLDEIFIERLRERERDRGKKTMREFYLFEGKKKNNFIYLFILKIEMTIIKLICLFTVVTKEKKLFL